MSGFLTDHIDGGVVAIMAFWIFFAGLLFYLRREDRREGYPLESLLTGRPEDPGVVFMPTPKTYVLEDGSTVTAPGPRNERRDIAAKPVAPWPGAPLEPTGDPMLDGVGPAAYAERADKPDTYMGGKPRIVPLRVAADYDVDREGPDPRGMTVVGADGRAAGTVVDLWVDRCETIIRYLEVELADSARSVGEDGNPVRNTVLLPMNFAQVRPRQRQVYVDSIMAKHFARVPMTRHPDQITLLEEDKICAYYGGGHLYAHPSRTEPLL